MILMTRRRNLKENGVEEMVEEAAHQILNSDHKMVETVFSGLLEDYCCLCHLFQVFHWYLLMIQGVPKQNNTKLVTGILNLK